METSNLEKIKRAISENREQLKKNYQVRYIGIFGSWVREEQREESDIDILVEFGKPIGFFKFLELEEHLSSLLGARVDLASKKALKPSIGKNILQEVVTVNCKPISDMSLSTNIIF